jgi:predicted DNA-binding transcriptional regulator AlpA
MTAKSTFADNLIDEAQVHIIDDLSRSGRYLAMANKGYPLPIRTGKRNRWPESAVRTWVASHATGHLSTAPAAALKAAARKRRRRTA